MNKKTKIMVAGFSFIGINISTLLTATIAWFNTNRKVEADGIVIKARNEQNVDIIATHIYTWDYEHDVPIETDDLNLSPFDCFISNRNVYARKFLKLTLQYPNGVPANSYLSIQVDCYGNLTYVSEEDGETYVDTKISNLIQFKYYDNIHRGIDETSIDTIYSSCSDIFDGKVEEGETDYTVDTLSKFVNLSGSGENITGAKPTKTIENHTISLVQASGVSSYTTDLYIEYRYNDNLIDYYIRHAEESLDLNLFEANGTEIAFTPDISRIILDISTIN